MELATGERTEGGMRYIPNALRHISPGAYAESRGGKEGGGGEGDKTGGSEDKLQPRNAFPSTNLWEKFSSEVESRSIMMSLFSFVCLTSGTIH